MFVVCCSLFVVRCFLLLFVCVRSLVFGSLLFVVVWLFGFWRFLFVVVCCSLLCVVCGSSFVVVVFFYSLRVECRLFYCWVLFVVCCLLFSFVDGLLVILFVVCCLLIVVCCSLFVFCGL